MKLIKQSFEIIQQKDLFKHIELCGRVSYKSENKITENSSKNFVEMIIKNNHTSVLEHGTVHLECPKKEETYNLRFAYNRNPYSFDYTINDVSYIVTNYRVLYENQWLQDMKYLSSKPIIINPRITVKFICSRGISHELVRHRVFSFTQESTRYCNYSKDKFNNEVTFIEPEYLKDLNHKFSIDSFKEYLQQSEKEYFELLNSGWKPEQAREILPNALKTEVIMTGFLDEWLRFLQLRTDSSAHPMMRELSIPLSKEINKIYINQLEIYEQIKGAVG